MTTRTPILKKIEYLKSLPQLGQRKGATLVAIFVNPTNILKLGSRQPYNSRLQEVLHWRARGGCATAIPLGRKII
jgi:hypothetical protein